MGTGAPALPSGNADAQRPPKGQIMNTHAEKKQEHRRQNPSRIAIRQSGLRVWRRFNLLIIERESIEQKTLEEMARQNSPRAMQLKAFRDMTTNSPVQRFPMPLDEQNNEVYTDSKHSWLRMIFREDLGDHTFELLKLDGNQSGSYMIFEREYRPGADSAQTEGK